MNIVIHQNNLGELTLTELYFDMVLMTYLN